MKFTISKAALQDVVQIVSSAVPTKSTLPILSNILIEASNEGLTLVATDLDLSIRTMGEAEVSDAGRVTVPARRLNEIVRKLPDGDVKVSTTGSRVKLQYSTGSSTLVGMDPEDFPQLPQVDANTLVTLPVETLDLGVKATAYAVSSDETRQMLTGVLIQLKAGELRLVATDGHRLAKVGFKGEYQALDQDLIVSPKALKEVVRLSAGQDTAKLTLDKSFAVFEAGPSTIYTRLIEGNFPNYEQVIPRQSPKRIHLNRAEFMDALDRVSVLSDNVTRQIKVALKPERIELSVSTADIGEGQESIGVDYADEPLAVGYNAIYLLDALKTIPTEKFELRLNHATSPGIVVPVEPDKNMDLLCLVMPLRLPENS